MNIPPLRMVVGFREPCLILCVAAILVCHARGGSASAFGIPLCAIASLVIIFSRFFTARVPKSDASPGEPLLRQSARTIVEASAREVELSALGSAYRKGQWEETEQEVDALLDGCLDLIRLRMAPHTAAIFFPAEETGYRLRRYWSQSAAVNRFAEILPGKGVLGGLLRGGPGPLTAGEIVSDSATLIYYTADAGVRSLVACPIVTGDTLRGLLLADSLVPHAFGDDDRDFLSSLGTLVGRSVWGAYLGTQHALEHRRLAAVSEIEKEFFRHTTVDAILDLIAKIVPFVAPCDRMTISTRMDGGECAQIRRVYGTHTEGLLRAGFSLLHKNLAGVLYVKNICFTRNFAADRYEVRYFDREPKNNRFASFLAVPLGIAECRGLILLESFRSSAFPAPLPEILSRIATSAGLAMERVVLLESAATLATRDSLTGLANLRRFMTLLKDEIVRSKRFDDPLALMLCDIDFFKKINDTWGHPFGNTVLKGLSTLLEESLRQRVDTVARYGGEEFACILVKTDVRQARETAERIRTLIASTPFTSPSGTEVRLTMSFGLAVLGDEIADLDALIGQADKALYRAKELGRNRVEVF